MKNLLYDCEIVTIHDDPIGGNVPWNDGFDILTLRTAYPKRESLNKKKDLPKEMGKN